MSQVLAAEPRLSLDDRKCAASACCSYCAGRNFLPMYDGVHDRLGHVGGEWSFVRCAACDSAQLRPFPRTEDLPAYYPAVYTFAPEVAQRGLRRMISKAEYHLFFRPIYRGQAAIVHAHTQPPSGELRKLLDIGCGRGLRLLAFRRLGYDVQGLDFDTESVEYVRSSLGVPAVCSDVTNVGMAFDPNSLDVVTAFHLVEHIVEIDAVIEGVFHVLKPGGWFAISGPLGDSAQSKWLGKRWSIATEAPRHVTIPTSAGLASLLKRHGFEMPYTQAKPDPALACAALIPLSLLPSCASTSAYGTSRLWPITSRIIAAALTFATVPWAFFENTMLARPAQGVVFGRKPL